jgi:hypothetical protein
MLTKDAPSDVVRLVNPSEHAGWDIMLAQHGEPRFFHGSAWAKVLADSYGYIPSYLTLSVEGRLEAMLPLMEIRSWLTGVRAVSLPFTDDCAVLGTTVAASQRLLREAMARGKERGWKYLEIRGGKELFPEAHASETYFGHELQLNESENALFGRLDGPVRTAIRKAGKVGLRIEFSQTLAGIQWFYQLHCKTRKRHGLPPQPFRFFRNIYQHVLSHQKGVIVIASHEERPVAANIYFYSAKKAIYKYGASDEEVQDFRANNLVMWEAIKWFARAGFHGLQLGRTSLTNSGLRRFKLGWGADETKIEYLRYDFGTGTFLQNRDKSVGWYNHIFRRLPVPISRLIGAILYQHIA